MLFNTAFVNMEQVVHSGSFFVVFCRLLILSCVLHIVETLANLESLTKTILVTKLQRGSVFKYQQDDGFWMGQNCSY